jgi:hypothetical protein
LRSSRRDGGRDGEANRGCPGEIVGTAPSPGRTGAIADGKDARRARCVQKSASRRAARTGSAANIKANPPANACLTRPPIARIRALDLPPSPLAKIQEGQRLSLEDGRALFASPDLLGVGWMADQIRRRRHGDRATFVFNRQINPTNICLLSCKFCDYASKEGWDNAYVLTEKEILDRLSPELREVHIVGGLYRKWSFDDYLNVLRIVRRAYPHIQLKAYTAVEVDYFSRIEKFPCGRCWNA